MKVKALLMVMVSSFSFGTMCPFTIVYDLSCPVCLQLDWCAMNKATQTVECVAQEEPLLLDAKKSGTKTLELCREYDQVRITVLHEDGSQATPVVLMVNEPYELDRSIDTSCRLVVSELKTGEITFKLRGKKFVEMLKKAALAKKLQHALVSEHQACETDL